MENQPDPPVMAELLEWCSQRVPGREARQRRMPVLMDELGDLWNEKMPLLTVTGTSGKGTTCVLLEGVLLEAGHVPGVCIKPHLFAFRERIRVGGRSVTNTTLERHGQAVFARLRAVVRERGPSFVPALFEALLFIAAAIFRQQGVSIAVFEAAIGGASDATAFLPARLSVITSVDLDHQVDLGHSIEEIAQDKAGIVGPSGLLVVGAGLSKQARAAVLEKCTARGVRSLESRGDAVERLSSSIQGQRLRISHKQSTRTLFLPFPGPHQALNLATVWTVVLALHEMHHLDNLDAIAGVEKVSLPGRFEFIPGSPSWLLDVAHNPASVAALVATASALLAPDRVVAIFGATHPHDYRGMLGALCHGGIPVGVCEGFPRAIAASELAAEVTSKGQFLGQFHSPAEAIACLRQATEPPSPPNPLSHEGRGGTEPIWGGLDANRCALSPPLPSWERAPGGEGGVTVLVTGSLFLVGQWRHALKQCGLLARED